MEKDDKEDLLTKYQERLKTFELRSVGEEPLRVMREEIKKLEFTDKNSAEFNVIRSYLDWLVAVPWNLRTQDLLHIQKAKVSALYGV